MARVHFPERGSRLGPAAVAVFVLLGGAGAGKSADAPAGPELVVQSGHADAVQSAAFTPDGKYLLTTDGGSTRLWRAETGELVRVLKQGAFHAYRIQVLADGRHGVETSEGTGEDLAQVRRWDLETGRLESTWTVGPGKAYVSPDGKTIAGTKDFFREVVWDGETGKLLRTLGPDMTGGIWTMAFSPDSRLLFSGLEDGRLRIYDLATGKLRRTLSAHLGRVEALTTLADGKTLVSVGDGEIKFWDLATYKLLRKIATDLIDSAWQVSVSSDGRRVAAAFSEGQARVWDAATGKLVRALKAEPNKMWSVAFAADGLHVVTSSGREPVAATYWDLKTGQPQWTLPRSPDLEVAGVAFAPAGSRLAIAGRNAVHEVNAQTGQLERTLSGPKGTVRSVAYSPDGALLAAGFGQTAENVLEPLPGDVALWETGTGALQALKGHASPVDFVRFSRDGKLLVSTGGKEARVWDVAGRRLRARVPLNRASDSADFSPDGKVLAATAYEFGPKSAVVFSDPLTGKITAEQPVPGQMVHQVVYSPDGKLLACVRQETFGVGGEVLVLDSATRKTVRALKGHTGMVLGLCFSPDGKTLLTGGFGGEVRVWDTGTGALSRTLETGTQVVAGLALSADGTRLAVATADENGLQLWNWAEGRKLATLVLFGAAGKPATEWLAVLPTGEYDASPGAARYFRWRTGNQLQPAEAHARTFQQPERVRKALAP